MSSKMNQIPFLSSYEDVRAEMNRDLQYRLNSRTTNAHAHRLRGLEKRPMRKAVTNNVVGGGEE